MKHSESSDSSSCAVTMRGTPRRTSSSSTKLLAAMRESAGMPQHYTKNGVELTDVIEAYGLGWHAGNVVKYVLRYQHKGDALKDLHKAQWYLERLIKLEAARSPQRVLTYEELEALMAESNTSHGEARHGAGV